MTKLRTNKKAHTLRGAAAFITAVFFTLAAMAFTACKQPTEPTSKNKITFSVDGGGGTLTAKIGETEIKSGNEVEANKTVTFTATPDAGYTVKEWKADGAVVTGSTSNTYTCTVTKALTVKVSFLAGGASYTVKHYQEKIEGGYPAEPAESENQNGTVGANAAYTAKTYEGFTYQPTLTKVNGAVQSTGTINADSSTVVELYYERNTVNVTFKLAGGNVAGDTEPIVKTGKYGTALTAPAPVKTDCVFKGWSPEPPTPFLFHAANAEYTAQWAPVYAITFGVDGGVGGTLKATVEDGSEITSGKTIEHGKTVTFTAEPSDNYEVDKWTITGGAFETGTGIGGSTTAKVKITTTVNITVSFKLKNYTVTFSVEGTPANGTLKAMAGSTEITSGKKVPYGTTVTFTATVTAGEHYVDEWTIKGGSFKTGGADGDTTATVQITGETEVKVTFSRYKSVAFGTDGADLAAYLNTGTPAADGIYYIKVTGLQAEHLKGNLDMHESSPLAKILQAQPAKKVALKFGKLPAVTDINSCFKDCKNLVSAAAIPKGVTNMESCFRDCKGLTEAPVLPASVTNLRDCFYNCEGLTEAPEIPESVTNMRSCFNGCKNLTQISPFPANAKVTDMNSCFAECESLTQVPALPASVTDITNCFRKCKNLTQAPEIPASVTKMTGCFYECAKLTKAPSTIPKDVTNLHSCFYNCRKLTKAPVIPKGVTFMKYCFKFCGELTEVTLECNYGISNNFKEAFFSCDKLTAGTIKVPHGQLSAYQAGADDMGTQADRFYE